MRGLMRSILAPATMLSLLCTTLTVAAPGLNSQTAAPRSLFLSLPLDRPEPEVTIRAEPQGDGGWEVQLSTRHFSFTETCLVMAEPLPIGHAHVLVDGQKVASAYQPLVRIGPLSPGRHELRVVLRGQDHRALLGRSGLIEARVVLDVPADGGARF